jgi:hypothetical protein
MMPSGVEHIIKGWRLFGVKLVPSSMMPSGVEHKRYVRRQQSVDSKPANALIFPAGCLADSKPAIPPSAPFTTSRA